MAAGQTAKLPDWPRLELADAPLAHDAWRHRQLARPNRGARMKITPSRKY